MAQESSTLEKTIVNAILKHRKAVFGDRSTLTKITPSAYSRTGVSDFIGCMNGMYLAIECKSAKYGSEPWEGLSEEQLEFLTEVDIAGGWAFVCNTRPIKGKLYVWHYDRLNNRFRPMYVENGVPFVQAVPE